jgi:DNA polymerase III subunit epsilon
VRSYFTAAETRTRMAEMVSLAASVTPVVCETALEARVRELRLIAEHAPRYNRRSRFPERAPWVKLTVEPYPRLSVVREVREDGAPYLGPFGSVAQAELAIAALHEAFPVRQCTRRLPRRPPASASACLLAEIGRCPAPCVIGGHGRTGSDGVAVRYDRLVGEVTAAITRDSRPVVAALLARAEALSAQHRFEEAAVQRDRLLAFVRAATRVQRLAPLSATAELVAALRTGRGGWELVLVRYGRLAGTTVSPPGGDPRPFVQALQDSGERVQPGPYPRPAAHPEETEQVLRWLEQPGIRLVHLDGEWSCPLNGAARDRDRLDPAGAARVWAPPFGNPPAWSSDRGLPRPPAHDDGSLLARSLRAASDDVAQLMSRTTRGA